MALAHLPFRLNCSQCEHILIEAFIAVDGEDIEPSAIIVEQADLMCPQCKKLIRSSLDDLSLALNMILNYKSK